MKYLLIVISLLMQLQLFSQDKSIEQSLFESSQDSIAEVDSVMHSWLQHKDKIINERRGTEMGVNWDFNFKLLKNGTHKLSSFLDKNGLKLVGYDSVFVAFEAHQDELFVLSDEPNNVFVITENSDLLESKQQNFQRKLNENFFQMCEGDLALVTLFWSYNEEIIETKCIISKKYNCPIYDSILSNVIYSAVTEIIISPDGRIIINKTDGE